MVRSGNRVCIFSVGKEYGRLKDQLKDTAFVRSMNSGKNGKLVMFVGNSITLHEVLPSIGWHNEWGMAASKQENDDVMKSFV